MMASWGLRWMLLLAFLMVPAKLYEIAESDTRSIKSLNLKLLRATLDISEKPNPSIHIGLRLSKEHNREKEREYLQRLKEAFQPSAGSSPDAAPQCEVSTGQLALYLLALRASCEDLDTPEGKRTITDLKHQLHEEKQHIADKDAPLSNYYQYSLAVLALCVNHKKIDDHVVQKLLQAEGQKKKKKLTLQGENSVDTEAMAGLAFLCLKRSGLYSELTEKFKAAIERIKGSILLSQGTDGAFGNIYSTALAVQVLASSKAEGHDVECSKAIDVLVKSLKLGLFCNPLAMSQLLPVLHHKTYLDIAKMDCKHETDTLVLRSSSAGSIGVRLGEEQISIRLSVADSTGLGCVYSKLLQVPKGSSLLEGLFELQRQDPKHFSFETMDTLSGPFVTTVRGLKATQTERTYWQLLKDPNTSLIEGVADYRLEDGEAIILRLAKW